MNRLADLCPSITPGRFVKFVTMLVVLYYGVLILTPFPHYVPPDFGQGFLRNKEPGFYRSGYFLGFYAHIFAAPLALFCGTLQISRTLRVRWPKLHRRLGRVYVALVLCLAAPGGAIMSTRALGGASSTICFAMISLAAWWFTWKGWRAAQARQFVQHGRWMCRSYLMMCSAILLRLIDYFMQPLALDPTFSYQIAAWLSWLPALLLFEIRVRYQPKESAATKFS
jgi:uncharacterized membrane protein